MDLCRHAGLPVARLDLLTERPTTARRIGGGIQEASPDTEVTFHDAHCDDPWDFVEVYAMLHDFARSYPFDTDNESTWCI